MLERCRARALDRGLDMVLHESSIETMDLGRVQRVLRYERVDGDDVSILDREWVLHWHTQAGFRTLLGAAGLQVRAVLGTDGRPAAPDTAQVVFIVEPAPT